MQIKFSLPNIFAIFSDLMASQTTYIVENKNNSSEKKKLNAPIIGKLNYANLINFLLIFDFFFQWV